MPLLTSLQLGGGGSPLLGWNEILFHFKPSLTTPQMESGALHYGLVKIELWLPIKPLLVRLPSSWPLARESRILLDSFGPYPLAFPGFWLLYV